MRRLALIGLGAISSIHRASLSPDDVVIVGGSDPAVIEAEFQGRPFPVVGLDELVSLDPDVFIVAVPTTAHHQVLVELIERRPRGVVLVEKPIAATALQVADIEERAVQSDVSIGCLYHARHAPEVVWGTQISAHRQQPVRRVEASFCDPYATTPLADRQRTYGTPWFDSGINALSVLDHFVDLAQLELVDRQASELTDYVATVDREPGSSVDVWCSWQVTTASKSTRVEFADGAVLIVDHQATAGRLYEQGRLVDSFGIDGSVNRLTRHYQNVFRWLSDQDWCPDTATDRRLHATLFRLTG